MSSSSSSANMRSLIMIVEGRETNNPDITYTDAGTTKAKTAAREFSKVTASVSGKTSEKFTKLAKKFHEIDTLSKQLEEVRQVANQEAKDTIEALFDVEDEVMTRYVETVSLSITMSKKIEESTTETSALNVDGFLDELMALVGEELAPAVANLLKQHTKVTSRIKPAQQGRVSVTLPSPVAEGALNENELLDKIANFVSEFARKVMSFVKRYDRKLDAIAAKYKLA